MHDKLPLEAYVVRNEWRFYSSGSKLHRGCKLNPEGVLTLSGDFWSYLPRADHRENDILAALRSPLFDLYTVKGGTLRTYGEFKAGEAAKLLDTLALYRFT